MHRNCFTQTLFSLFWKQRRWGDTWEDSGSLLTIRHLTACVAKHAKYHVLITTTESQPTVPNIFSFKQFNPSSHWFIYLLLAQQTEAGLARVASTLPDILPPPAQSQSGSAHWARRQTGTRSIWNSQRGRILSTFGSLFGLGTTVNCLLVVKIELGMVQLKKCVCNYRNTCSLRGQAVSVVPRKAISLWSFSPHSHWAPAETVRISSPPSSSCVFSSLLQSSESLDSVGKAGSKWLTSKWQALCPKGFFQFLCCLQRVRCRGQKALMRGTAPKERGKRETQSSSPPLVIWVW